MDDSDRRLIQCLADAHASEMGTTRALGEALDELVAAGVGYEEPTDTLEREGVEIFADSFKEAIGSLQGSPERPLASV